MKMLALLKLEVVVHFLWADDLGRVSYRLHIGCKTAKIKASLLAVKRFWIDLNGGLISEFAFQVTQVPLHLVNLRLVAQYCFVEL